METFGHQNKERNPRRIGMVIKLRPECLDQYLALHADSNAGVRDLLAKYHMKNFSIFLHQIGNDWFEFGYYEYDGTDFVADMAALEKEPRNQYWLEICNPMQIPLQGESGWATMKQVYYNEGKFQ
jgi:L-rhamnose mutarotase